jgi:hypothetical protein
MGKGFKEDFWLGGGARDYWVSGDAMFFTL